MSKDPDLTWLVERRNHAQTFLLRLHDYLEDAVESHDDRNANVALLLVGAGFSLWRAVALSQEDRPAGQPYEAARAFLRAVIEDDAVTFNQDKATRAWTAGYYINSAVLRLDRVYRVLPDVPGDAHRKFVQEWLGDHLVLKAPRDLHLGWDEALGAAGAALGQLEVQAV